MIFITDLTSGRKDIKIYIAEFYRVSLRLTCSDMNDQ